MPTPYANEVPAVARALTLMDAVAAAPGGLAAGALEEVVDGSRSGLYALLNTLKGRGWLAQDVQGAYVPGPVVRQLGSGGDDRAMVADALGAALANHTLDETVVLVTTDPAGRHVTAVHSPDRTVRCCFRVGDVRDGATSDAIVLRADLDASLAQVRATGVARVDHDDIVEVAAPVCRDGHRPDAVIVVAMPVQRGDDAHVRAQRELVQSLAAEVSRRLGAPTWQPWGTTTTAMGDARPLDDGEVQALLSDRFAAQLACLRHDGTPHVVPLWFEYDGTHLWLAASPGSSWSDYIGDGGSVSLTVEEPWPHLRRVFVQGKARPVPEAAVPGGLAGLRRRLAVRHLGPTAGASQDLPATDGWSVVQVTPDRIHGRAGLQVAS